MFALTKADQIAVDHNDHGYLNNKGAEYYSQGKYDLAVEYYRIAAAMGDDQSVSNLGYCYLYGRQIEADLSLALAYFKIACDKGNVDAAYKLGDIYGSDKWGVKDRELSVYYYRVAAVFMLGDDCSLERIMNDESLQRYPSLCFALGREHGLDGKLLTELELSYAYLQSARKGYELELMNGNRMHEQAYNGVLEYLNRPEYQPIREKYEMRDEDLLLS